MGIKSNDTFTVIPRKDWELERDMLIEEIEEYDAACRNCDIIEIADALGDMLYLIIGAARKHGLYAESLEAVVDEIQKSNMSKMDPRTGKAFFREDGKVMKPESYVKPDLKGVLEKLGLV